MGAERPQGRPYQRLLFPELEEDLRHDTPGDGRSGAGVPEEPQTPTASEPARALTERLMEEVCQADNLNQAQWFEELGLVNLVQRYETLQP